MCLRCTTKATFSWHINLTSFLPASTRHVYGTTIGEPKPYEKEVRRLGLKGGPSITLNT